MSSVEWFLRLLESGWAWSLIIDLPVTIYSVFS